jgi:hypothetical protein
MYEDTGENKYNLLKNLFAKIGNVVQIQAGTTAHAIHANPQISPLSMSMIKSLSQHNKLQ